MKPTPPELPSLSDLDQITEGIPFTHDRVCRLLHDLVAGMRTPNVVEIACCYGKATAYMATAAARTGGFVYTVDHGRYTWRGQAATDLLRKIGVHDFSRVDYGQDGRWWLLDLITARPQAWIDLAYLDASHILEVDGFLASALWRHISPGGFLVLDDLDWIPAEHADVSDPCERPDLSNVRALYEYVCSLDDVGRHFEWGREEVQWAWGIVQKEPASEDILP